PMESMSADISRGPYWTTSSGELVTRSDSAWCTSIFPRRSAPLRTAASGIRKPVDGMASHGTTDDGFSKPNSNYRNRRAGAARPFAMEPISLARRVRSRWDMDSRWTASNIEGAIGAALKSKETLALTEHQIGLSATCYLAGAVLGALIFGYATDRFGRKKLFYTTLSRSE